MNEFIRKSKYASQTLSSFSKVHVVIGNEACDLDSTVSAITHAYHLSQDSQSDGEAIIPVLNVPKDELPLRTETTHLLPRCNVQLTDLICRDEIDLKAIPNLTLTLVDHNVPAESDTWLDQYVVEVIDHRVNSRHDNEDRVISITREMVGSCSTLVARQILDQHLEILDHQLVKLLLGTILLDTLNLSEAAGRATPTDEDVVKRLRNLSPRINLQELFDEVQAAKFNISGLTTAQILRKDFKSTSNTTCKVGFSSATLPLKDVLDREDLDTSLQNFCEHRFLDVNIIMTIDLEGSRQLAIYSEDQILRETMEERLQGSVLELERINSNVTNLSAFDQHNRKASRKVVLPLVEEILRTLDSDSDHDEEDEHGENGLAGNVEELSSNVNNANNVAEEGQQNGKVMPDDWGEHTPEGLHENDDGNDKIGANDHVSNMVGTDPGAGSGSSNPFGGSDSTDLLGGNPFSVMTGSIDEGGDDPFDPLSQSGNKVQDPTQSIDVNDDPFGLSLDPFSAGSTPLSPKSDSHSNSSNPFQLHSDPFSSNDNVLIPTDPNTTPSNPFSDGSGFSSSLLDLDPVTQDNPSETAAQSTGDLLGSFMDPIPISSDLPSFVDSPVPTVEDSSSSQLESRVSIDDPFSLMSDTLNDQYDMSMTKSDPSLSFSDSLALVPDVASSADDNSISISDPCLTTTESKDVLVEVEDSDPFLSQMPTQKSRDQFHSDDPFGMDALDVQVPSDGGDQIDVEGKAKENSRGFEDNFGMVSMAESSAVDPFGTMGSTPVENHAVDELSVLESAQRQTLSEEVEVGVENDVPNEVIVTENAVDAEFQSDFSDHGSVEDLAVEGKVDSGDVPSTSLPDGESIVQELVIESDADMENSDPNKMDPLTSSSGDNLAISSDSQSGLDPFGMQDFTVQPSSEEVEVGDVNVLPDKGPVTEDAVNIEFQSKSADHGSVEDLAVKGEVDSVDVLSTSLPDGESIVQELVIESDADMESSDPSKVDPLSGSSGENLEKSPDSQSGLNSFGMQDFTVQPSSAEVELGDDDVLPEKELVTEDAVDVEIQSKSSDHGFVENLAVEGKVDSEDVQDTSLPDELGNKSDAKVENSDPDKMDPFSGNSRDNLANSPDNQSGLDPFGMQEFTVQPSSEEVEVGNVNVLHEKGPVTEDAVNIEIQSKSSVHGSVEDLAVEGEADTVDVPSMSLPDCESIVQELDNGSDTNIENSDPNKMDPFSGSSGENLAKSSESQSGLNSFGIHEFSVQSSSDEVLLGDEDVLPDKGPVTEEAVDAEIQSKSSDHGFVENLAVEGNVDSEDVQGTSLPDGESIVQELVNESDAKVENSDPDKMDPFSGSSRDNLANSPDNQSGLDPFGMQEFTVQPSSEEVEVSDVNVLPEKSPVTEDAVNIEIQSKSSDHGSVEDLAVEGEADTVDVLSTSMPDGESFVQELHNGRGTKRETSDPNKMDPFSGSSGKNLAKSSESQSGLISFGIQEFSVQSSSDEVLLGDEDVLPDKGPVTEEAVDAEIQSKSSEHGSVEDLAVEGKVDSEDVQGTSLPDGESIVQELESDADMENSDPKKMGPFSGSSHDNIAKSTDNQSGLDPFGMQEFTIQPDEGMEEPIHSESFSAVNYTQPPTINGTEDQNTIDPFGMSPFDEVQSPLPFDGSLHQNDDLLPASEEDDNQLREQSGTASIPTELHGVSEQKEDGIEDIVSPPKTPRNSPSESSLAEDEERSFSQELDEKELSARFSHLEETQADANAEVDYEDDFEEDDNVFSTDDQRPEHVDEIIGIEEDIPDSEKFGNQFPGEESDVGEIDIVMEESIKGHEVSNLFASPPEVSEDAKVTDDKEVPVVEEPEESYIPPNDGGDVRLDYSDEVQDEREIHLFNREDENYIGTILGSNMVDNAVDINTINSGNRAFSDDESDIHHTPIYSSPGPVYKPEVMAPNPDPLVYIQAKETERLFENQNGDPNYVAEMIYVAEHGEPLSSFNLDTPPFHTNTIAEDSNVMDVHVAIASDTEVEVDAIVIEESCSPVVNADLEASPVQSENLGNLHDEEDGVDPDNSKEDVNYVADMLAKSMVDNAVDIHTYISRDDVVSVGVDVGLYDRAVVDYRPKMMEPNPDPSVYIQAKETGNMFVSGRVNEGNHIAKMLADDMVNEERGEFTADSSHGMTNRMNDIPDLMTSEVSSDVHASHPLNENEDVDLAENGEEKNYVIDMITDDMVEEANEDSPTDVGSVVLLANDINEMPDLLPSEERNVDLGGTEDGGYMVVDSNSNDMLFGDEISSVNISEVQAPVPSELILMDSQNNERTEDDEVFGEKDNVVAELLYDDMVHGDGDDHANNPEDVAIFLRENEFSGDERNDRNVTEDGESGFKEEDDNNVAEMLADNITFEEGKSMMSTPDLLISAKSDLKDDFFQNIGNAEQSSPQGSDDEENSIVNKDTFEDQPSSESDEEEFRDKFQADGDGFIDIENDWSPNDIKVELSTEQYTVNDILTVNRPCATTGTPLSPLPEETEIPEGMSGEISVTSTDDVCVENEFVGSADHLKRENEKVLRSHESYSEDDDWEEEGIPDPDRRLDVTPDVLSVDPGAVDIPSSDVSGLALVISNETENRSDAVADGDGVIDAIEKVEEEIVQSATNKTYDIEEEIEEEIEPVSDEENEVDTNRTEQIVEQSEKSFPKSLGNEEFHDNDEPQEEKYPVDMEAVPDVQYKENDIWNERRDNTGIVTENVISVQNTRETEAGVNLSDLNDREEGLEQPNESGEEQGNVVVDMISEEIVHENRGYVSGLMGDLGEDSQNELMGVKASGDTVEDKFQQQSNLGEDKASNKSKGEGSKELHGLEREHEDENEHLEPLGNSEDRSGRDNDKPTWDGDYNNEGQGEFVEKDKLFDETSHVSMESESLAEQMPNADNTPAIASSMHTAVNDVQLDYSQEPTLPAANANTKELPSDERILGINNKNRLEGDDEDRPENFENDIVEEEITVAAVSAPVHSKFNTDFYEKGEDSTAENEDGKESVDDGDAQIFSYPTKWTDEDHETMDAVFPDLMVKDVINENSSEEDLSDEDEEQGKTNLEVTHGVSETIASDVVQDTENDQREDLIFEEVNSTEQSMPQRDMYHVEDDPDSQHSAYDEEFSQEEQGPRSALVDKVLVRMLAEDMSTNEYVPSEDEMIEIEEVSAIQKEFVEEDSNLREIRAGNDVAGEIGELDGQDEDVNTDSEAQIREEITISSLEANMTESSPSVSAGAIYDSNQMTDDASMQDTSQDLGDGVMDNSSSNDVTVSLNEDILQAGSDAEDITPANDFESETVGNQDHTVTESSLTDVSISEQETKSDGSSGQSYLVVEPYERFIISDIDEADEENEDGAGLKGHQETDERDPDHVVENWFNTRSLSSEFGEGLTEDENRQKEAYEKWGEPLEGNQIEASGVDQDVLVSTSSDLHINAVIEETQMVSPNAGRLDEIPEETVGISSTEEESSNSKEGVPEDVGPEDLEGPREVFLQDKYFENSFGEDVSDADSNKTDQEGELLSDNFNLGEERAEEGHKAVDITFTHNQGNTENDPDDEAVHSLAKEYVDHVVMEAAISYRMSSNEHAMSGHEEERNSTEEKIPEVSACAIFEQAAEEYIDHVVSHEDEGAEPKVTEEYFEGQESETGEGQDVNDPDENAPEILVCRYTEPKETAMPFIMESGEDLEDTDEVNNPQENNGDKVTAVQDPSASEIREQDDIVQEIVPVVENMPVTETALSFVMEPEQYASSDDDGEVESHDEEKGINDLPADESDQLPEKEEDGFDDDFSRVTAETIPRVRVTPALVTEYSMDSEIRSGESGDAHEYNEEVGATAVIEELIAPASPSELQTNPTNFYHLSNDEDDFDDTYSDLLEESKKLESDIAMLSSDIIPEVDIHVSPALDAAVIEDEMGSEFLPHVEQSINEQIQDVTEESVPSEDIIVPLQQGEVETLPSRTFDEELQYHRSEAEATNIEEVAREFVNEVIKKATKDYVESGNDGGSEETSNREEEEGNTIPKETISRNEDDDVFEEYDHFDDSSISYQKKDSTASVAQASRDFKKTVSLEESLVAENLSADSDEDGGLSPGEGSRITRPTELPLLTASGQGLLTTPSKKSRIATSTPAGMSPGSILSGDTPVSLFTPDFESVTSTPGSLSDQEAEALDTGGRLLPMSPFDKKSISVDESVTKNLEEEWDEKEAILNAIRAKQEEAERRNMQLEDPSMRQMSLDSEDALRKMQGVSVDEEWQDDEYSRQSLQGNKEGVRKSEESDSFYKRPVPKDERESGDGAEHILASDGVVLREKKLTRPNTLLNRLSVQSVNSVFSEGSIDLDNISDEDEAEAEKAHSQSKMSASKHGDPSGARPKEKRKIRAELSLNLDDTITSQHTDDGTTPAILTPTSTEMSWEDDTPMNKAEPIEEYTAREEHEDRWRWRKVNLGGKDYTIDMKAINPYKKVLSHGGYYGEGLNAIIVFASCYLPEKTKKDYTYIMNNLFLYVVSTLELLVAQEYVIIYFHGSASRAKIPSLGWMRKCYQMIDRKLRKSLKGLYLVHPTTWLKAIVQLTKPFISHKFSNKLKFVKSLAELKTLVSMEYVYVPEEVKRFDQNKNKGGGTIWGWIAGPPPVDDEDWFSLEEGYDSDYSITADFLLSPHNPPNWHRRRQRKRLLIKAGHFNFSSSDEEGAKDGDADGRRHHRRNLRHHHQDQQLHPPPKASSHHEDESSATTPGSIGINLGPAITPQDYLTEWYFKRRSQSCSGFIEDDTFSYNHIIATPEVERRTWKEVFGDELEHGSVEYDGEDEDEDGDCCDGNSATESHGQLELSS